MVQGRLGALKVCGLAEVDDFRVRASVRSVVHDRDAERLNRVNLGVGDRYCERTAITGASGMEGSRK